MGIYIKNMKMPTSCDECRIMALEDTNCEAELYCGCPIVFKAHPQGVDHRPDYCPLVPVPPHRRLIDADALYEDCALDNRYEVAATTTRINEYMQLKIDAAPTIIPAEQKGE